jgi:hypothetical protein
MDITARRSERSTPPAWPSWMCHDKAPKHSPKLEDPPGRPPTLRHGQIASQLHPSKYEPRIRQSATGLDTDTAITYRPSGGVTKTSSASFTVTSPSRFSPS